MICPVGNAYALHKALPESELVIIPYGAHALTVNCGTLAAVIKAADRFATVEK